MRLPAPDRTVAAVATIVGILHVVLLLGVEVVLGYPVGAAHGSISVVLFRTVGLALLAAAPVAVALRYGLVTPLLLLVATTGFVVSAELSPPQPTFQSLGGYTVVEDGLYVAAYAHGWYVWLVTAGFAGLAEAALRDGHRHLAPLWSVVPIRELPLSAHEALRWSMAAGLAHAVALAAYAVVVGVSGLTPPILLWITAGMAAVGAAPVYLTLRHRLSIPLVVLVMYLVLLARADFHASPDGPVPLYVVGWPVFLGLLLLIAAAQHGARGLRQRLGARS